MKKTTKIIYMGLIIALLLLIPVVSGAESPPFAGGTGTAEDPYQIETKQQLAAVDEYLDASFVLINDITFEDSDFQSGGEFYNEGNLWKSIGTPNSFNGNFDGNGYIISNLQMSGNSGLFENISSNSVIKNLTLENVNKIDPGYGTICIYNYGIIENCTVKGIVYSGQSSGLIGGLVGINKSSGIIRNCCNLATVYGRNAVLGGIAANNEGHIANSYNAGNVLLKCSDSVYGSPAGGIAGKSSGTIENCYNAGYLNKSYDILPGGIVGVQMSSAVITNSYTISNFDSNDIGTKLNIDEMKTVSAFSGFDFENIWGIDQESGYPFPYLISSGVPAVNEQMDTNRGTGTNYDPYQIKTAADFDAVRNNLGACYVMVSDIDLSSYEDWEPIGVCENSTPAEDNPFVGRFIGDGYKITGINSTQGGLFGGNEGLISGVVIESASVIPQNTDESFGAVVGINEGAVEACVNKADFNVNCDIAGGIAGCNYSIINKCANHGTIAAAVSSDVTGGIAGENRGYITASYNCGKIAGNDTGGISGSTYTENGIENVFNAGNITGIGNAGGIVSDIPSNKIVVNNAYNAGIIAGNYRGAIIPRSESYSGAIGENVYSVDYHSNDDGVQALNLISLDEMDEQSSFTGFDFDNIWTMGSGNYALPCISGIEHPVWGRINDNFDGGTGTLAEPYLVSNLEQLKNIQDDTTNCFQLTSDIDLGDEKWEPISDMYFGIATGFFGGVLDGNNNTLSNMNCDSEVYSNGFVAANVGVIKNLNMHNASVCGSNSCVGIIAGQNFRGQISNCGIYGNLELMTYETDLTKTYAGGITGTNTGTIDESFFYGTINIARKTYSNSYAGGISGNGGGSIRDCYAYLTVDGPQNAYRIGGISGITGSIDNTYSICDFDGLTDSGWKPYGITYSGTVTNSYYTCGLEITGAVNLTLSDMQNKEAFTGFDFDNVWVIYEGGSPYLKGDIVPIDDININIPVIEYEVGMELEELSVLTAPVRIPLAEIEVASSDENVLKLNDEGNLTVVGPGNAEIIVSYGNLSDRMEITAYPATEKISALFDGQELLETYIYVDTEHVLDGISFPEGANNKFIYSSSNPDVLNITNDGKISVVSCGIADVIVTNQTSSLEGRVRIHVVKPIPETLTANDMSMLVGDSQNAKYDYSPSEGVVAPEFVSSDPKIVSVSSNGEIEALSAGTAKITISFDNGFESISEEFTVTVKQDLSQKPVALKYDTVKYNGKKHSPAVTIEGYKEGVDYCVEYTDNLYPGTAAVTVIGIGDCCGYINKTFTITSPKVAAQKKVSINLKPTNGYKSIKATWSTQKIAGATVKYIVKYKKAGGKWLYASKGTTAGDISVKGLKAGKQYYFNVTPYVEVNGVTYKGTSKTSTGVYTLKAPTYVKVSKNSKYYVRVKWTGMNGESGYQIQRSKYANRGFITVKKVSSKYSAMIIKAPRNTKYYYRVRAYKNVGNSVVYGPWSKVKSYKLK